MEKKPEEKKPEEKKLDFSKPSEQYKKEAKKGFGQKKTPKK
jgi:hypothetical protein